MMVILISMYFSVKLRVMFNTQLSHTFTRFMCPSKRIIVSFLILNVPQRYLGVNII